MCRIRASPWRSPARSASLSSPARSSHSVASPRRSPPIAEGSPATRVAEIIVRDDEADLVSGLLWAAGVSALAEHDGGEGHTLLRTDLPPGGVDALRACVGHLAEVRGVDIDDDGLDAWRDHAEVVLAGERVVIRPTWVPLDSDALPTDPVVLLVDPARSWGHGAHPTTRLCLAEVETACQEWVGMSVLDVGCGSGLLSIAAARLGAGAVDAVDIDPAAVEATRANAARNDVADRVAVHQATDGGAPLAGLSGTYDLVLANIGAATLVELADEIVRHTSDDGTLVLSGLLDPVDNAVLDAFEPWRAVRTEQLDGWAAVVMRSEQVVTPRIIGGR